MPPKIIYLWSDVREKSYHQTYIVKDYVETLTKLGFGVLTSCSHDWARVEHEVLTQKPTLFLLHGGKVFPPDLLARIHKRVKVYLRWRWHPDPPINLLKNCFVASKVSFVKESYGGKLFYSPHPAITKYFYMQLSQDEYKSNVFFVGLAGNRGGGFYKKAGRVSILESGCVRYLNQEMFGTGNKGFYDYEEIAKYYNGCRMALSISSFPDEVNFRIWNAMACGVPVISDTTPAMLKHFKPDEDYISFDKKDLNGFEEKVRLCLRMPDYLRSVAMNGYRKVKKKHTSLWRLKEALERAKVL